MEKRFSLSFLKHFSSRLKRQLGQAWTEAAGNGLLSQIGFALNHGSRMQFGRTAPKSYLDPKVWPTWKGQAKDGTSKLVGDWIPLKNSGKCSLGCIFPRNGPILLATSINLWERGERRRPVDQDWGETKSTAARHLKGDDRVNVLDWIGLDLVAVWCFHRSKNYHSET